MPAPKTTAGGALLDLGGVHGGAETGREAAGEQRAAVQRGLLGHLGQRDLRHHRVLRERARAHEVADRLTVAREPDGAVGQVALVLLGADRHAEVRARAQAVHALAALGREERDDVVADLEVLDALAELLDDARALMAEHGGRVAGRVGAGGRVHVGVADAACHQADQHLARLRARPGRSPAPRAAPRTLPAPRLACACASRSSGVGKSDGWDLNAGGASRAGPSGPW